MHIDYEISEQDYLKAQNLAIKNHPRRAVRWTRIGLPIIGVVLPLGWILNFILVTAVLKQTLPSTYVIGLLFPLVFICTPLLNKRSIRKLYTKSTSLHGKLWLRGDEDGVEFGGSTFQSKVDWSVFDFFFEDDNSFVLLQKTLTINMVPKTRTEYRRHSGTAQTFSDKGQSIIIFLKGAPTVYI